VDDCHPDRLAVFRSLDQHARSAAGTDEVVGGNRDTDPQTDPEKHIGECESMNENDRYQRIPLSEITVTIPVQPKYVLVLVVEKNGGTERVVHCDLREFGEALAIYDGANQNLRGE
jgi:hypothetical protein